MPGGVNLPAEEATLTMCPRPRGTIRSSASLVPVIGPCKLMSTWRAWLASSSSTNGPRWRIPALLIITSIGPSSDSTRPRKASNEARSVTSSSKAAVGEPISPAAVRAASASTSPIATRAPFPASAPAVARPMPRAPPVMATTFPCKERAARATGGTLTDYRAATAKDQEESLPDVEAHITGTVWKVECEVGQKVEEGDTLVILESMKMEMPVEAEDDGVVKEISCKEGQSVSEGDTLVVLE